MKTSKLDVTKLLGFRIIGSVAAAKLGAKTGGKAGGKYGGKMGAKPGMKS